MATMTPCWRAWTSGLSTRRQENGHQITGLCRNLSWPFNSGSGHYLVSFAARPINASRVLKRALNQLSFLRRFSVPSNSNEFLWSFTIVFGSLEFHHESMYMRQLFLLLLRCWGPKLAIYANATRKSSSLLLKSERAHAPITPSQYRFDAHKWERKLTHVRELARTPVCSRTVTPGSLQRVCGLNFEKARQLNLLTDKWKLTQLVEEKHM